jgi:hypothetical protein
MDPEELEPTGIAESDEDQLFAEMAAGRESGRSLRALSGTVDGVATGGAAGADAGAEGAAAGADAGASGDGAGAGPDAGAAGAGAGADAGADAGDAANAGAGAAGSAAGAAGAGPDAGAGVSFDTAGVEGFVESFRKTMADLGDAVIEPASDDGKTAALTLKDFDAEYPGVAKRMDMVAALAYEMATKQVMAKLAPDLQYVQQQRATATRDAILSEIDGEGTGKVAGAREMADSPQFAQWFGKQPATIQSLGRSAAVADAAKLLNLFAEETKYQPGGQRRAAAGSGRTADGARVALATAKAGGGAARAPEMVGRVLSQSGGANTFVMDEEDADAEFNRLASERARAKA